MKRFAISLDADLADRVRAAAGDDAISAWLADAAETKLRSDGLISVVREWEHEHGDITAAELRAVARKWQRPKRPKRPKKRR